MNLKNKAVLNEFHPARLIQARLAKKWTQPELAERVSITRQAISAYEKEGGSAPTPENLRSLSRWLDVPEHFFFTPLRESETKIESAINFRTLKSSKKKARQQAVVYMQWLVSTYDFLGEYLDLPLPDVPDFDLPHFTEISMEDIEDIAERTRRHFKLGDGPISNLTRLLENKGFLVCRIPLETGIDGVSAWFNGRPVILVNENAYHARSRFDLAHELFHIIAHRNVTEEDLENKESLNLIEKQAHRFAGAFLAPYKTFLQEVYSIDMSALIDLKRRWGVSAQAMVVRLCDLGVISEHQKTRFFTKINAEGWRRKEPLDQSTAPETTTFVDKAAAFFKDQGLLTNNEFLIRNRMPENFMFYASSIRKEDEGELPQNVVSFQRK